jgi:DivIVA domain-containing protein
VLTVLSVLGVLAVLFVAAVVSTREGGVMADAPRDAADVNLPAGPLRPVDVHQVRFGLAVRGYRMSEVDEVLDRLAGEIAVRDSRIAELESGPAGFRAAPASPPVVPIEPPLDPPPGGTAPHRSAGGPEGWPGD